MTGFKIPNSVPAPAARPRGGGFLRKAFIAAVAGIGALVAVRSCTEEEQRVAAPPPVVTQPEPEPQRVPYYFALATSYGSVGHAGASTRAEAELEALEICKSRRQERINKHVYVGAEDCKVAAVASNFSGPGCIAMSLNNITYRPPNIITGSAIDIENNIRAFLHGPGLESYNDARNPQATTTLLCVDYYGRPSEKNVGYRLSR